ncbi:MAG: DUF6328 family protein [Actinomycetales bacterium]|jgi:hypothetical protein|nr:DUF6328 family protein [Leifsonia sp.]
MNPTEPGSTAERDADGDDGRHETRDEKADRNWGEVLQELRVTQTGTQLIAGFLLTLAFQQRFQRLDTYQITVYLILVFLAAFATAFGLAPVSMHRGLFRRHRKPMLVAIGDRYLRIILLLVSLLTSGVVLLIVDVVTGNRLFGVVSGVVVLAVLVVLLVVLPARERRSHG